MQGEVQATADGRRPRYQGRVLTLTLLCCLLIFAADVNRAAAGKEPKPLPTPQTMPSKPDPLPLDPAGGTSRPKLTVPAQPVVPQPQAPQIQAPQPAPEEKLPARTGEDKKSQAPGTAQDEREPEERRKGPPEAGTVPVAPAQPLSEEAYRALERRGIVRVEIRPAQPRVLSAPFSAELAEVLVRDGEPVAPGQIVARFDTRSLVKGLEESRAALAEAVEKVQHTNDATPRAREEALAGLERGADRVNESEKRLTDAQLASPVAGRVTEISAKAGQMLKRGDPVLELAEAGNMEIVCMVPSAWIPRLEAGHLIWVYIEERGRSYEAEFVRFGGRVDSATRSIRAYARFREVLPELLPGMGGRADFFPRPGAR